jgi:4-hydroxy-tetrahydrodipicolinate reductase
MRFRVCDYRLAVLLSVSLKLIFSTNNGGYGGSNFVSAFNVASDSTAMRTCLRTCHGRPATLRRSSVVVPVASEKSSTGSNSMKTDEVFVMVNGMPGPMATAAAEACLRKGLRLAPVAITGPDLSAATITVVDPVTGKFANVRLVPSSDVDDVNSSIAGMLEARDDAGSLVAIDYTHPSAVNANARRYVDQGIPFVMGTTGGDRDQLLMDCKSHSCVIAPNMGKQIVAMQAALESLSIQYPGAYAGYKLHVRESHQVTKADTSGTAKAVVNSLKMLNADPTYSYDDIVQIRDEEAALQFGVPGHALKGHAFHTYTLTSPDGSVEFQLKHNVSGRTIYAEGTADAVKFLAKKIRAGEQPKVYSMINVLEEGALA